MEHFQEHCVIIDQKRESSEVVDRHASPAKPVNPFYAAQEIFLAAVGVLYLHDLHPHGLKDASLHAVHDHLNERPQDLSEVSLQPLLHAVLNGIKGSLAGGAILILRAGLFFVLVNGHIHK